MGQSSITLILIWFGTVCLAWFGGRRMGRSEAEEAHARAQRDLLQRLGKLEGAIDQTTQETILEIMQRPAPEPSEEAMDAFIARSKKGG